MSVLMRMLTHSIINTLTHLMIVKFLTHSTTFKFLIFQHTNREKGRLKLYRKPFFVVSVHFFPAVFLYLISYHSEIKNACLWIAGAEIHLFEQFFVNHRGFRSLIAYLQNIYAKK